MQGFAPLPFLRELEWSVIKKAVLLFFIPMVFLNLSGLSACAVDVYATGGWNLTVDSSCLVGGAGSGLIESFESGLDASMINITGTSGSADAWRVRVRKSDALRLHGVTLYVKRTGDGSGSGIISGGTSYTAVETSDADFFDGCGDRTGIAVQYKVSGISINVPPGTYSTVITFTVVDR